MPKYNNLSILRRIDQHDLKSIRRVMSGLYHTLEVTFEIMDGREGTQLFLTVNERRWVNSVFTKIMAHGERHTLLRDAAERFFKARSAPDRYVIEATKELDQLAEEDVLLIPSKHIAEYEEALKRFYALPGGRVPVRRKPLTEGQFFQPEKWESDSSPVYMKK